MCGVLTWVGIGSSVDLGPKRTTIGVEARLVGVDALATFFLTVVWNFAKHTNLLVPVGVAPGLQLFGFLQEQGLPLLLLDPLLFPRKFLF